MRRTARGGPKYMARKTRGRKPGAAAAGSSGPGGSSGQAGSIPEARISSAFFWQTALLLAVAVVLSAFLVAKHFGGGLPGCGPKSGCEALESTVWGRVP